MELNELSATDAAAEIARGTVSAVEMAEACLQRVEAVEGTVQAWTFLDPDHVRAQARALDEARRAGRPCGPLHGLPVGIKDIIDTDDMPTECGTPIDAGRRPRQDSAAVARLRAAGAVIMGKTVTTELAVYHPGKTRNPQNPIHTPGGSSSGSAAAVAAGMVPLALGTQTNGSIVRPASYCGVVGYKPTHGLISRRGVLATSRCLDTVGIMARSVEDAALLADALVGHDEHDPDTRPMARMDLLATASAEPPVRPSLAFVKSPVWNAAEADVRAGFGELTDALGDVCREVALPSAYDTALNCQRTIMHADIAKSYAGYYEHGRDRLSDRLRGIIEDGQKVTALAYLQALDQRQALIAGLEELFQHCDAIITPATTGEAPVGLESTGSPIFCTLWSLCGVPCLSLPLLTGSNGLPMGVQIVGRPGYDGRLLRTARWLMRYLSEAE